MSNRLNLDFHLITSEERKEFVKAYLDKGLDEENEYVKYYNGQSGKPFPFPYEPTPDELETIANYILYGKATSDSEWNLKDKKGNDGNCSVVDAGYVEIQSRNSAWNRKPEESLDRMYDDAVETGKPLELQYGLIRDEKGGRQSVTRYKVPKPVFDRVLCRERLTEQSDFFLLEYYEQLWRQIDVMEYTITSFEIRTGKRKAPIREELEMRLTAKEKCAARAHAGKLNIYGWSKLRKMLVELRRDQYLLRDSYAPTLGRLVQGKFATQRQDVDVFERVLPCGLRHDSDFIRKVFMEKVLEGVHFEERFRQELKEFLAEHDVESTGRGVFNFENVDHVTLLVYARDGFKDEDIEDNMERAEYIRELLDTLDYYVKVSKLAPIHREIIDMKAEGKTNDEIRQYVNKKYDKHYSANYISTIFRAKCCTEINNAARSHREILEKILLGREYFKECNTCGLLLLRDNNNFVKKARSKDGLAGRCKSCDKKARVKRS